VQFPAIPYHTAQQGTTNLPHARRKNSAVLPQVPMAMLCGASVSNHTFKHFRAAVKDAADGNWEGLRKNPFFQLCCAGTRLAAKSEADEWTRERAFFTFLEERCLTLIRRAVVGSSPTERLIDACRLYAQAFLGEYYSAATLEKRLRDESHGSSLYGARPMAEQLLSRVAEKVPELAAVHPEELITELHGPVSRDTFERSVRRALSRLHDTCTTEIFGNGRAAASDSPIAKSNASIKIGSLTLSPEEADLWHRVLEATREQCSSFDTVFGRLPIEASIPRLGVLLTSEERGPVRADAVVQRYAHVLVSAPLGGGLSTLAAQMARELTSDDTHLTIMLSLASHGAAVATNGLLHTFVHDLWGKSQPEEAPLLEQLLHKATSHNSLNLILDGWDEMETDSAGLKEELSSFERYVYFCHTPCPAISHPPHDVHLALLDPSNEEIAGWLYTLLKVTQGKFSEAQAVIILDLLTQDAIAELNGSKPLVLAIALALTRDRRQAVPAAEVLWHVIDRSLANVRVPGGASSSMRSAVREWLAQLALWMLWGAPPSMKRRKDDTLWHIPSSLLEPPALSSQPLSYSAVPLIQRLNFAQRSGIIHETEMHTVAFANPWLQRILAAEAIVRQPEFALELTSLENRAVLRFAAWVSAQTHGRAAALQEVIGNYRNPREHTHLEWMLFLAELLAQFATGNAQTHWAQTTRSVLEQKLFATLRACPFVNEQLLIGRALAALGSQQALAYCRECLADHTDLYPAERLVLIRQLRWFASRDAAVALASAARSTDNAEEICAEAIRALCKLACSDGIIALRDLVSTAAEAQRKWLVRILRTMREPVARFFLLTMGDEAIPETLAESSAQMSRGYVIGRFEQLEARDIPLSPSTNAATQGQDNLTDVRLIEQLIGSATAGHAHERHAAAFLLNRVPPTLDAHSELNRQTALRLLLMVESETDPESRWAAYRVLKLGAPPEIFGDLTRLLAGAVVSGHFAARALIDILASRQFMCQVLESRSVPDASRLLLMLRFGFHVGVDYATLGQGRAVFSLSDGREVHTCAELSALLDPLGGNAVLGGLPNNYRGLRPKLGELLK
jgi:hypothetical protein